MTNEQRLIEIETALHAQPAELRALYTAKLSVDAARATVEPEALRGVLWQAEPHNTHPQLDGATGAGVLTGWLHHGGGKELGQLAGLDAAAGALARHGRMAEAEALFGPLLAQRDKLRAAIAAEAKALEDAREKAAQAHREAVERAAAAAANDPQVVAAQAALAALETPSPAPPPTRFRGRVAVGAPD